MDAGDMICEQFSQKAFNPYYARSLISFFIRQSKGISGNEKASFYNAQTSDGNVGNGKEDKVLKIEPVKDLSESNLVADHDFAFDQEVNPSNDIAAIKAHVLKDMGIDCVQTKETLLFTRDNYNKYLSKADDVKEAMGEIFLDPLKVNDITVAAKINDKLIEDELFASLPVTFEPGRDLIENVAKNTKAMTTEEFREDVKLAEIEEIKNEVLGQETYTDIEDLSLAASVPEKNLDNKQFGDVEVFWDEKNLSEPNDIKIKNMLDYIEEKYPDKEINGIELAVRQNEDKVVDVSFYSDNNKFAAITQKREPYEKNMKRQTNKEKVFERIRESAKQKERQVNPSKIKDKTLPNVKIPNK